MPRVESAMSGTMQLMSYKEILDGMLAADNRRGPIEPSDARMQGLGSGDAFNGSQDCPISLEEEEDERSPVMAVDIDVSSDRPYDRFSWYLLFRHLNLDPCAKFSSHFLEESRTIVIGNALEADLLSGTCLWDYVDSWVRYVAKLGLGKAETPGSTGNLGRSEDKLELVYRNVKVSTSKKEKSKRSKRNKSRCTTDDVDSTQVEAVLFNPTEEDTNALQTKEEERLIALAIAESLKQDSQEVSLPDEKITVEVNPTELEGLQATLLPAGCCVAEQDPATIPASDSTFVVKEEAPASQAIDLTSSPPAISSGIEPVVLLQEPKSPIKSKKTKRKRPQAGSIIGTHVFQHDRVLLSKNLERTLNFWMGSKEPEGVGIENVSRCGWCEFEEGCEWR
jgi:exonuclease V